MKAVFLSDVHLKGPEGAGYDRLMHFFSQLRGRHGCGSAENDGTTLTLDQLVIAGDFFDFWFSKGEVIYPGFRQTVDKIVALNQEGVKIAFCEGNHDYFMKDYFFRKLGFDVHQEWAEFRFDGLRVLASHGDTVDESNHAYLALRRFLRSSFARCLEQLLPRSLIWRLARLSSNMSREVYGERRECMVETMSRFAMEKLQEDYDAVILGHCHVPFLRQVLGGGRMRTFVTLGDWMTHGSYLLFDNGSFSLQQFPP